MLRKLQVLIAYCGGIWGSISQDFSCRMGRTTASCGFFGAVSIPKIELRIATYGHILRCLRLYKKNENCIKKKNKNGFKQKCTIRNSTQKWRQQIFNLINNLLDAAWP